MKFKKLLVVAGLVLAEIVFLLAAASPILPYRYAAADAFARYRTAPTAESQDRWLKEGRAAKNMVRMLKGVWYFLGLVDAGLIVWILARR
jgi:hypothetical protein